MISACAYSPPKTTQLPDANGERKLYPYFAYFSPTDDHLLVTLCKDSKALCWPWRYYIEQKRWEKIAIDGVTPETSFGSAVYSPDGTKLALEMTKCVGKLGEPFCILDEYKVAILDLATKKLTLITPEKAPWYPSFSRDGKSLLYWGLEGYTRAGSGRAAYGAFNVYSMGLDGSSQTKRIVTLARAPLAPITGFVDNDTVAISAEEVSGKLTYRDETYRYGFTSMSGESLSWEI